MNYPSVRHSTFPVLLIQACLWGQVKLAVVQGVVTDPSGAAIPKAEISAFVGSNVIRTTRTDALGRYTLNGLPAAAYTVRAVAPGFAPLEIATPQLVAGSILPLNISLTLSSQSDQVTVEAQPVGVDTDPGNNAGALVLQKKDLEALPDDRDDLSADLQALAGPAAAECALL